MTSEFHQAESIRDEKGRTVQVGHRGSSVEIIVTPHSGHAGRILLGASEREEFVAAYVKAVRGAVASAADARSLQRAAYFESNPDATADDLIAHEQAPSNAEAVTTATA